MSSSDQSVIQAISVKSKRKKGLVGNEKIQGKSLSNHGRSITNVSYNYLGLLLISGEEERKKKNKE